MAKRARRLGELENSPYRSQRVKEENRGNLLAAVQDGRSLFPGIAGFGRAVIPGIFNALLARHNFILLGLRGEAKTRFLRSLTVLLDDEVPWREPNPTTTPLHRLLWPAGSR